MRTLGLFGLVVLLLAVATLVVRYLRRRRDIGLDPVILETVRRRISAWWFLMTVIAASSICGRIVTILLFGMLSFWSLREFITLTPTRPNDHRALFWMFAVFTPLQFILIGFDLRWGYLIFLPIFALLFVPIRLAIANDPKRFLERTTKIQFAMLLCLFCLSYAPALLVLPVPGNATAYPVTAMVPQENPSDPSPELVDEDAESTGKTTISGFDSTNQPPMEATPPMETRASKKASATTNTTNVLNVPKAEGSSAGTVGTADTAGAEETIRTAELVANTEKTTETANTTEVAGTAEVTGTATVVTVPVRTGPTSGFTLLESGAFRLLFFLILIVQLSDSLQYAWSLLPGRHPIASEISPGKTVEGLIGSVVCTALIGTVLCWATPWPFWYTTLVSAGVAAIGQMGSLAMSAVKRDRGVRDYGTLVAGHDGVLDRIDSLCFSAPFFYFMLRVWIFFRT